MDGVTLGLAILGGVLVFCLSPVYGLIVFIASVSWYPSYLTVKLGTADFSVCRLVILALFAKLYLQTNLPKQFKFNWLDRIIIIYFLGQMLAGVCTSQSTMEFLENRAGGVFDMVLPYFAVRMIITDRQQYLALLKGILVVAAPLAVIGLYQSITGNNPMGFLLRYHAWLDSLEYRALARHGFYRATVTFGVHIMFGLFFAILGPICVGLLRAEKKHLWLCVAGVLLMGVGVFSSMSSGPILASGLALLFIAFYRYQRYWKVAAVALAIMCGTVEIISNRHFWDVLGRFTFDPATAWYRSRLIEVAFFEGGMSGHWLMGYGLVDPGWHAVMDGRDHTDIVNHYILTLVRYGLVGLVPFLVMVGILVKRLRSAFRLSSNRADRWMVWCLGGSLFGLLAAMVSVSIFGPSATIFYLLIGFCGVMPMVVHQRKVSVRPIRSACQGVRGNLASGISPAMKSAGWNVRF